jgi:hypothetical protein
LHAGALLVASYALRFMGQASIEQYRSFERDRDAGDFGSLPELHATLSVLKVLPPMPSSCSAVAGSPSLAWWLPTSRRLHMPISQRYDTQHVTPAMLRSPHFSDSCFLLR